MCSLCTGFVDVVGHLEAEDSPLMKLIDKGAHSGLPCLVLPSHILAVIGGGKCSVQQPALAI